MRRTVSPMTSPVSPSDVTVCTRRQLPETAEMRRTVSLYWNWAVIGVTNVTARAPSIVSGWAASTKEMLEDMLVITPEQVKEKAPPAAAAA